MIHHTISDAIFWIAAVCCLVAQLAILRSAIAAPMNEPPDRSLPHPRRGIEVAWTLVPAAALLALFVVTWREIRDRRVPAGERAAVVASVHAWTP